MVEIRGTNFATEVIEKSYEKIVLVDFFATWCGPCKLLKPILEKLESEYNYVLRKVDIDQNPDLASAYGVEGVPDVRIVVNGEVLPGFVGALSEGDIRQFLEEKLELRSGLDLEIVKLQDAIALGQMREAKAICDRLFETYPNHPQVVIESAKFLVAFNQPELAEKMLNTIREDNREFYSQAQAVKGLIQFKQAASEPGETELDQRYSQACGLVLAGKSQEALEAFLDIVGTSRKFREDGARKAMLVVFDLLGDEHPLTKEYRKKLLMQLY